jgi:hypothetical protein
MTVSPFSKISSPSLSNQNNQLQSNSKPQNLNNNKTPNNDNRLDPHRRARRGRQDALLGRDRRIARRDPAGAPRRRRGSSFFVFAAVTFVVVATTAVHARLGDDAGLCLEAGLGVDRGRLRLRRRGRNRRRSGVSFCCRSTPSGGRPLCSSLPYSFSSPSSFSSSRADSCASRRRTATAAMMPSSLEKVLS